MPSGWGRSSAKAAETWVTAKGGLLEASQAVPSRTLHESIDRVDSLVRSLQQQAMKLRMSDPGSLIDLSALSELAGVTDTGACLRIGAMTRHAQVADLFSNLISAAADVTHQKDVASPSLRVIADHIRASTFLILDGVLPSNEGRGYVLRRIMRRAMRHAELLGAREPVMWKLVPSLTREMGQAFPELVRAESLITETLKLEETRFRATLTKGLSILDDASNSLKKGDMFDGETAFTLYDTYGFPLDLTADIGRERGIEVDMEGFEAAMDRQRERARATGFSMPRRIHDRLQSISNS